MRLLKQNGFSIVQGLMLAALLSGTALVTSRLVADQKKSAISVRSKDAAEELASLAFNILQHQDNCQQTIIQNGATAIAANVTRPITRLIATNTNSVGAVVSNQVVLQTNSAYFGNSVSISSMSVTYRPHPTLANHLDSAIFDIRISRNQKNSAQRTKDGFGTKDFSKKFNLIVKRNPGPLTFKSCYAVELDKNLGINTGSNADLIRTIEKGNQNLAREFCDSLQPMFLWDTLTNTCNLRQSICPPGSFYVGIGSNGGTIVTLQRVDYAFGGVVPIDYVFGPQAGVTSTGMAYCRQPKGAFNMRDLIYSDGSANCVGQRAVGFQVIGNQIRIRCGL